MGSTGQRWGHSGCCLDEGCAQGETLLGENSGGQKGSLFSDILPGAHDGPELSMVQMFAKDPDPFCPGLSPLLLVEASPA